GGHGAFDESGGAGSSFAAPRRRRGYSADASSFIFMETAPPPTNDEPPSSRAAKQSITERIKEGWENLTGSKEVLSFQELYDQESQQLEGAQPNSDRRSETGKSQVRTGPAGEP